VNDAALRKHLIDLLKGGSAHVQFMDALEEFPPTSAERLRLACRTPAGNCWSMRGLRSGTLWSSARNAQHVSPGFPEGYWPKRRVLQAKLTGTKACSNSSTTWTRWLA